MCRSRKGENFQTVIPQSQCIQMKLSPSPCLAVHARACAEVAASSNCQTPPELDTYLSRLVTPHVLSSSRRNPYWTIAQLLTGKHATRRSHSHSLTGGLRKQDSLYMHGATSSCLVNLNCINLIKTLLNTVTSRILE